MRARASRGFSLFELVVVIVVIAILSGLLLARVLPLIGQAERVAFLQTKQQIQNALLLEAAGRVVRGESGTLASLTGTNPMDLLLEPPGNYAGTISRLTSETLPRRSWLFDGEADLLVYRPGRQAKFEALEGPADRIEMRVSFVYRDRDEDGAYNASIDRFDGLRLESLHPYAWPD
ncbi:MAG TPA: prepilin-type N-terminal cleavage/methylation domain-containing protein [Gammaproteobacteria bacterium]|nr:prepilin-type N-terminal cleavage/methylation domain-containing protein [Gammaproteobacteria bacterium]